MPKRATQVVLSEKEQEALTRISRRYRSEQQVALRARLLYGQHLKPRTK